MRNSSLPTRIGRRLFGAFLIVAAVPVVTVSVYALGHFSSVVATQQQRQLGDALRSQGHLLLARFDEVIALLPIAQSAIDHSAFLTIEKLPSAGNTLGKPALDATLEGLTITMPTETATLRAVINPTWFWETLVSLPPRVIMCVESVDTGTLLYCGNQDGSDLDLQSMLHELPGTDEYADQFDFNNETFDVAYWELFLNSKIAGASWRFTAFRRADDFTGALAIGRFLPLLVALSIAVAALFSLILLRRRLTPLQLLTDATTRVSQSNFNEPVIIEEANEFGDLGRSFNFMMERLQEEISRYRINAEIDRLILQSESTETVLNLILGRAFVFVDADFLTICVFNNRTRAICQSTRASDGLVGEIKHFSVSDSELAQIANAQRPVAINSNWLGTEHQSDLGGRTGLLLGINWHSRPLGFLFAGIDEEKDDTLALRNQLVELRDRIAVTLTAAEKEKALFTQANFDTLTGLPNRRLLEDRLKLACGAEHKRGEPFALVFMDLDNFKLVNDSLGHSGGDTLLDQISHRLHACSERGDTVARLGGDEFVVLLGGCNNPEDANRWVEQAIHAISRPLDIDGQSAQVNASAGIALYPADGSTPEALMRNADAAMYRSKELGRNRVTFFTEDINRNITRKFQILTKLRHALEHDQLALAFQPQLDMVSGKISGAEVLVRWPGSNVSPGEMIQIAEQYGMIGKLGRWVLENACAQLTAMQTNVRPPRIAVNVSALQLADSNFVDMVSSCLSNNGLSPGALEIEITESLLVDNTGLVTQLNALKDKGLTLALDDFGTGFSSLTYLQKLPVDYIKIDRSFVTGVDADLSQQGFVSAVVQLAHSLGKKTIAEGAENEQELKKLAELGCDHLQGYVFCRPILGIDGLAKFIANHQLKHGAERQPDGRTEDPDRKALSAATR